MAKTKKKDEASGVEPDGWLDEVRAKLPFLYDKAASLQPFDDVITEQWIETACFGIGIDVDGRVCPSGVYSTSGARIYADHVIMFTDMHMADGDVLREEYRTDMAGLWSYLRQVPRPMHSFGKWTGGK